MHYTVQAASFAKGKVFYNMLLMIPPVGEADRCFLVRSWDFGPNKAGSNVWVGGNIKIKKKFDEVMRQRMSYSSSAPQVYNLSATYMSDAEVLTAPEFRWLYNILPAERKKLGDMIAFNAKDTSTWPKAAVDCLAWLQLKHSASNPLKSLKGQEVLATWIDEADDIRVKEALVDAAREAVSQTMQAVQQPKLEAVMTDYGEWA